MCTPTNFSCTMFAPFWITAPLSISWFVCNSHFHTDSASNILLTYKVLQSPFCWEIRPDAAQQRAMRTQMNSFTFIYSIDTVMKIKRDMKTFACQQKHNVQHGKKSKASWLWGLISSLFARVGYHLFYFIEGDVEEHTSLYLKEEFEAGLAPYDEKMGIYCRQRLKILHDSDTLHENDRSHFTALQLDAASTPS